MDTTPEPDDGRWLTKAELAQARRIDIASATRLIRRQGWRRQPGNDGRVRVLVPADWMHPRHDDPRDDPSGNPRDDDAADPMDQLADPRDEAADPRDNKGLLVGALAALEDAVAVLRESWRGRRREGTANVSGPTPCGIEFNVLTAELAVAEQAAEQAHAEAQRADRAEAHAAELHGAVERANAEATLAAQALDAAKAARPRAESLPTRLLRALRGR